MKVITANSALVAFCGLYCGACGEYLRDRCRGCGENEKAGWCKVRACCAERRHSTCADCREFSDPAGCGKYNNLVSKLIGILLNSDRRACILRIREIGLDGFAALMAGLKRQSFRRRGLD